MSNVRAFPPLPTPAKGHCRWCGEAVRTAAGLVNFRAAWHRNREGVDEPDCLYEYYLHTRLEEQYPYLVDRDGERCWDCGETPLRVVPGEHYGWYGPSPFVPQIVGPYCGVEIKPALEVEHEIPLWLVAHLSDEERRPYFGPENLRLRCIPCHQRKSSREASERAHGNRLRNGPKPPGRPIPSRPMGPSRGFGKQHRPLRS